MDQLDAILRQLAGFSVVALGVVVLLVRFGSLRRGSLKAVPARQVDLTIIDLFFVFVWMFLFSVFVEQLMGWLPFEKKSDAYFVTVLLLGQAVMLPIVCCVLWRLTRRPGSVTAFGLRTTRPWRDLVYGVAALLIQMPIFGAIQLAMVALSIIFKQRPPEVQHEILAVVKSGPSQMTMALLLSSAIVLAPILEEIIYRGFIQTALLDTVGRGRRWLVILISAAVFTIAHGSVPWQGLPALFVLGIMLGWLYERTGSLWPAIVLHMGFNAINFLFVVVRM